MLKRAVSRTRLSYVQRARLLEKIKTDDKFCKQSMETGRFLLYHKGQPLLRLGQRQGELQAHFVDFSYCDKICDDVFNTSAALSVAEDGVPMFATSVLKEVEAAQLSSHQLLSQELVTSKLEAETGASFTDLKVGIFLVNESNAQDLCKGWSLLTWARNTRFCSVCGSKIQRSVSGAWCRCGHCGHVTYPITAPVGMVSVANETNDKLLLVRQPRHPGGMYTCIAGFLDAGEAIEDCVRREVAEEVGLEILSVIYKSSQPWPFRAGNVMIGCHAQVAGDSPTPDPCREEIADANGLPVTRFLRQLSG